MAPWRGLESLPRCSIHHLRFDDRRSSCQNERRKNIHEQNHQPLLNLLQWDNLICLRQRPITSSSRCSLPPLRQASSRARASSTMRATKFASNVHHRVYVPRSRLCSELHLQQRPRLAIAARASSSANAADPSTVEGLPEFLESLKYDDKGLVTVIVQVLSQDLASKTSEFLSCDV